MIRNNMEAISDWDPTWLASHPDRPSFTDYIREIVEDFCELHGDRRFGDDRAMITGFGIIGDHRVMLVGNERGQDTARRIKSNFGCAHPEGYRKALIKMKLAEKFGLPVVCIIDTKGAYPDISAEQRGIARSIAVNACEMSRLRTVILCVVIGEGGSSGALGIGVGDRVAALEHACCPIFSREGNPATTNRNSTRRKSLLPENECAAYELQRLGFIDDVIPEPPGGAHVAPRAAAQLLKDYLVRTLAALNLIDTGELVERRYARLRAAGSCAQSVHAQFTERASR